ncbi:cell surface glycoprotein CD200 receptor 1 isoform X2 [Brachyhypopomus gauderio]|uniref:cell surface glycoprotein CD200 receptor 1 isoform X2 n=1 Tax=Brachyhypopomus gauderio TaxID=698409 RepID=UPI004041A192
MEREWILSAVYLLAVCTTGNLTLGTDSRASLDVNKTTPHRRASADIYIGDIKNENFEIGANVTLLCTESKIEWKDVFYVIWNISLQDKNCRITAAENETEYDTCKDGKKLGQDRSEYSYLTIPDFSLKDEGNYTCEMSYHAGSHITRITVSARVQPRMTTWFVRKQDHSVAFCEAADGKPAASIHWETKWNSTINSNSSVKSKGGLFTVMTELRLPQNYSSEDIFCVVSFGHPNQTVDKKHPTDLKRITWPFILLAVCVTCFTVTLLTVVYLMRERLLQLSIFRKVCCESKSSGPIEEKLPQPLDPEEVEPYASYVQRVNSIYNSSAELFNA